VWLGEWSVPEIRDFHSYREVRTSNVAVLHLLSSSRLTIISSGERRSSKFVPG